MNPKRCMKCLFHGDSVCMHSQQDCPWKECSCRKCSLIDSRRNIANKIIALSRKQKLEMGITENDYRYMCTRCRNHGIRTLRKHHTPCPYSLCHCEPCNLNNERQRIERELKAACKDDSSNVLSPTPIDSDSESTTDSSELSQEAKIIIDLINALASDSFDPEKFDYNALSDFFSKPYIRVPDEWIPMMGDITDLVLTSLKRFPRFDGIDFALGISNQSI